MDDMMGPHLLDPLDDAVVGIGAAVGAGQALETRVLREPARHQAAVADGKESM